MLLLSCTLILSSLCSTDPPPSLDAAYAAVSKGESALSSGDMAGAAAHFEAALSLGLAGDDGAGVAFNLGLMKMRGQRGPEALKHFTTALALNPTMREAHLKSAFLHKKRGDATAAAHHLREAITLEPNTANAYTYLGEVMNNRKRFNEAATLYKRAIAIEPRDVQAHLGLADARSNGKRPTDALAAYAAALKVAPGHGEALAGLWSAQMHASSWEGVDRVFGRLLKSVRRALKKRRPSPVSPYQSLYLPLTPRSKTKIAASWAKQFAADARASVRGGQGGATRKTQKEKKKKQKQRKKRGAAKLQLGYMSRRFEEYPGTQLMLRVFGAHSRKRFAVTAFAHGPPDGSAERAIVANSSDAFHDISQLTSAAAVATLKAASLDMLIDYDGLHGFNSMEVLSLRPAPLQLTWLGFAGSTGAGRSVDLIVADATVVPPEDATDYAESLLYLPRTYQPRDSLMRRHAQIAGGATQYELSRAEAREEQWIDEGLPSGATVYVCFNRNDKIDPNVYALWMSLLARTPSAVLWLLGNSDPGVVRNLRAEAAARGVAPSRLVFARRVTKAEHIRRHRLAHLALDTLHYGMHTTAADALAAGVPLVTMLGASFSSRVAASLLRAAGGGLELGIVRSLRAYVDVAARLAGVRSGSGSGSSARMGSRVRAAPLRRLNAVALSKRTTRALFDDAGFQRGLDRALSSVHEACRADLPAGMTPGKGLATRTRLKRRCAYGAVVVPRED